jgi:prepilin-type N-terminal cleavage/methylation domain-containing protein
MSKRFTLVEMMIVVAIVVILAAIAIPELNEAQLKAKRSEVPLNVEGIVVALMAYDAAHDKLILQAGYVPNGTFNKRSRAWVTTSAYQTIGFRPDGRVRGGYYSPAYGSNGVDTVGRCDVDDDGVDTYFLARIDEGKLLDRDWMVSTPDVY